MQEEMTGRNDHVIAYTLMALPPAIQNNQNQQPHGRVVFQGLDCFQRRKPPMFKGGYDLDNAQNWVKEVEKIFRVMECTNAQKVMFDTYVLVEEVEY
ncbi:hypothetical protein CR513_60585, partial [Mucuna pruriens]